MSQYLSIAVNLMKGLDIVKTYFLPDKKHEEILHSFRQLSTQIGQVRDDIKGLEQMIKWEITQMQYGQVVEDIMEGMHYCLEIGKESGKTEKMYQNKLKNLGANEKFTRTMNALLNGITGKGLFRKSILDEFYNETKGDRAKISALANRLQQLVCGGMIVLATYETMMHEEQDPKEMTKRYGHQLKEVNDKIQSVIGGCVGNFEGNMLSDLNAFLDTGRPNKGLLTEVSDFMRDKYDWLENFCIVYNDLHGFHQHCFNGHRVSSLHRSGKCGIVFYRSKGEPPRFSNRYAEAYKIVDDACKIVDGAWFTNAEDGYKNIVAKLGERGIGWTGCAVIRRGPDLWFGDTFSTNIVSIVGKNVTAILLLQ